MGANPGPGTGWTDPHAPFWSPRSKVTCCWDCHSSASATCPWAPCGPCALPRTGVSIVATPGDPPSAHPEPRQSFETLELRSFPQTNEVPLVDRWDTQGPGVASKGETICVGTQDTRQMEILPTGQMSMATIRERVFVGSESFIPPNNPLF